VRIAAATAPTRTTPRRSPQRVKLVARGAHLEGEEPGMGQQDFARCGQRHALALPFEQLVPQALFHCLDHPAERGLCQVHHGRRPAQAAGLGHGEEGAQVAFVKIHAQCVWLFPGIAIVPIA
jgi:hypothetical protein